MRTKLNSVLRLSRWIFFSFKNISKSDLLNFRYVNKNSKCSIFHEFLMVDSNINLLNCKDFRNFQSLNTQAHFLPNIFVTLYS